MEWNREEVGDVLQSARLKLGLTQAEVGEMAGLKTDTVRALEKGAQRRPPRTATQARLERALGVKIHITRGTELYVMVYVPADKTHLIDEVQTKWPEKSKGAAVVSALQSWSDHQAALRKWNKEHPGANLEV